MYGGVRRRKAVQGTCKVASGTATRCKAVQGGARRCKAVQGTRVPANVFLLTCSRRLSSTFKICMSVELPNMLSCRIVSLLPCRYLHTTQWRGSFQGFANLITGSLRRPGIAVPDPKHAKSKLSPFSKKRAEG